jgi:hypothetical protein
VPQSARLTSGLITPAIKRSLAFSGGDVHG